MAELSDLHERVGALLASLEPAQQKALIRTVARQLRASQAERIKANRNPDGSVMEPRKPRIRERAGGSGQLRARKGSIRRAAMFRKIHRPKYMKAEAGAGAASVSFTGAVSRIARVHQYGLRERVGGGQPVQYPRRELLGFTENDVRLLEEAVIDHLAKNLKG
jgi:phage virion morphogenesis protein